MPDSLDVTELLKAASSGDDRAADRLMPLVYRELHSRASNLMRRESSGHTLQATALVNEAYLKLIGQNRADWQGRSQFYAVAAQAMRRILVDHARRRCRHKRGGDSVKISLDEGAPLSVERDADIIALDDVLRKLTEIDERQARIVEMRFFAGMSVQDVADGLGMSKRSVEAEWTMIKAWLRRELVS